MKRWLWLPIALTCAGVTAVLGMASGGHGELVSGEWYRRFQRLGTLTPEPQTVTDCAFGPGRLEVAFLGPKSEASALWIASGQALLEERERIAGQWKQIQLQRALTKEEEEFFFRPWTVTPAAPRLLWKAPADAVLRGPIHWAPTGDALLVYACQGETRDLVAVDYVSGEATWLTHGVRVEEAAWVSSGKLLAYVGREGDTRRVWLRRFPEGEPKTVGEGGYDLRWSPDSGELRWLAPVSPTQWAEMVWNVAASAVSKGGPKPARPEGTIWSPDGRSCAALVSRGEGEGKQIAIWRASAETGDAVPLPDLSVKRLLSWSPDSLFLLVQAENDGLYVINANPPTTGGVVTTGGESGDEPLRPVAVTHERVEGLGTLLDPEAGPPAWSSDGLFLAFACADPSAFTLKRHNPVGPPPRGRLVMLRVWREHVTVHEKLTPKIERAIVTSNAKNVAIALNMYLADWDGFPTSNDQEAMLSTIEDYVRYDDVFMRPGSQDEVVVRWLFDPAMPIHDIADPAQLEIAIIDYHPDFYVVAYVDGHARAFDKKKP